MRFTIDAKVTENHDSCYAKPLFGENLSKGSMKSATWSVHEFCISGGYHWNSQFSETYI